MTSLIKLKFYIIMKKIVKNNFNALKIDIKKTILIITKIIKIENN